MNLPDNPAVLQGMVMMHRAEIAQLREALSDALKTAEFERHAARPWHHHARVLLAKHEAAHG